MVTHTKHLGDVIPFFPFLAFQKLMMLQFPDAFMSHMQTGRHSGRRGFKTGFHQDCVVMTLQGLLSIQPARLQYMDAGLRRMPMMLEAKITGTH